MSNSKSVSNYRRRVKEKAIAYKGGKCIVCSYDRCNRSLHFYHIDPSQKDIGVGSGNTIAFEKIKAELDKCVLLCSNCHGEVHDGILDLGIYLDKSPSPSEGEEILSIKFPKKESKANKVCSCGNKKHHVSKQCAKCYSKSRRKINWPPIDELLGMVEESNYLQVAKSLGVSDNAVRKHIKNNK